MKKFLLNTLAISVLFIGFISITVLLLNYHISKKAIYPLNGADQYLILGHSHPQCAYDDSIIHGYKNVASGGESYFFTYYKSLLLLKNSSPIKGVFIEFTNNQIESSMNDWIWGDKYLNERYPYYSPYIEKSDLKFLISKNSHFFSQTIPISIKKNTLYTLANKFDYTRLGGYTPVYKSKTDSFLRVLDTLKTTIDTTISYHHISYLKKLIALFQEKNIKVFLIRSPQHKKYNGYYNEKKFMEILKNHFDTIPFLDFSSFPLKNSEFADLEHLNKNGSMIFSSWFYEKIAFSPILQNNNQDTIEDFIKREIELGTRRLTSHD